MATSVSQTIAKMKIGNADKIALTSLIAGMQADIETLRAASVALAQKLDAAGAGVAGLGTNYNATVGVPATKLVVGK